MILVFHFVRNSLSNWKVDSANCFPVMGDYRSEKANLLNITRGSACYFVSEQLLISTEAAHDVKLGSAVLITPSNIDGTP